MPTSSSTTSAGLIGWPGSVIQTLISERSEIPLSQGGLACLFSVTVRQERTKKHPKWVTWAPHGFPPPLPGYKSRPTSLPTKVCIVKSMTLTMKNQIYDFSSNHVWIWELDYKEGLALKNWCFWTVVLEKTLESPLDSKEIKPVNPKGNQSWIFTGRTDAEAEAPIFWPPDARAN